MSGRDATREFEDVGHSGGARARLDSLVIGTVRPATNEELRISRDGGVSPGKTVCNPSSRVDALNAWMQENLLSMRNVGIIGVAAAALLGTALFLKRHGSGSLYNSRR